MRLWQEPVDHAERDARRTLARLLKSHEVDSVSTAEAQLARYSDIFLDEQYENGSDGQLYEYELVYYPTSSVVRDPEPRKVPQPDSVVGLPFRYISDDKEDYRWTYLNKNNRQQDDYAQLIEFTRVMGLGGGQFIEQIGDTEDTEDGGAPEVPELPPSPQLVELPEGVEVPEGRKDPTAPIEGGASD